MTARDQKHPSNKDPRLEQSLLINRRQFFSLTSTGIGVAALSSLLPEQALALGGSAPDPLGALGQFHHPPRAKRVIYLFQSGAPSQLDLFDYKAGLADRHGTELPASVRGDQRVTGMTANQDEFPVVASRFAFNQHGQSGAWVSELMPNVASVADDLCFLKAVNTEAINHDPGITFFQTGHQQPGRPSLGAWLSYGLGSENENLPAFVVLISQGSSKRESQALFQRLWGTGFLPSEHQGVQLRSAEDPVLYLSNPPGVDRSARRAMLDSLAKLNQEQHSAFGDPEILARIAQYEMAYRMQASVPGLVDLSDEPESTFKLYGEDARHPGSFAANCLLARRLAERDVRFIQLYHRGWDQHGDLVSDLRLQCRDVDRASAALITDLKQRGLLEDTLVIWGGEFGRTVYCQGRLTDTNYGRDHHGRCFTMFMAGAGVTPGMSYGETDDFGYNITEGGVHVHDLNATILHLLGIDHERLTYPHQGRDFRLTDVHGRVVQEILS